jgi:hypothetical protein
MRSYYGDSLPERQFPNTEANVKQHHEAKKTSECAASKEDSYAPTLQDDSD